MVAYCRDFSFIYEEQRFYASVTLDCWWGTTVKCWYELLASFLEGGRRAPGKRSSSFKIVFLFCFFLLSRMSCLKNRWKLGANSLLGNCLALNVSKSWWSPGGSFTSLMRHVNYIRQYISTVDMHYSWLLIWAFCIFQKGRGAGLSVYKLNKHILRKT